MSREIAERAVDLLVNGTEPGAKLNLAFLGGEPLVNRPVLQAATLRAAELAGRRGVAITFSITTNGTLLTEEDAISSSSTALRSPSASTARGKCTTRCGPTRAAAEALTRLCAGSGRCSPASGACRYRRA